MTNLQFVQNRVKFFLKSQSLSQMKKHCMYLTPLCSDCIFAWAYLWNSMEHNQLSRDLAIFPFIGLTLILSSGGLIRMDCLFLPLFSFLIGTTLSHLLQRFIYNNGGYASLCSSSGVIVMPFMHKALHATRILSPQLS